jgi:Metallo-beta-lactamase superfamily
MPFSEIAAVGPPHSDQIEICIFGPNYGECIVAHVGNGNWIVVDSCIHGDTKEPVALVYLRSIGINPATAIKVILATHWHDDHYRGFSQILSAAPAAHVWIASALTDREFLQFASRMGKNKTAVAGNKLSEFSKTIGEIRRRHEAGLPTFGFASAKTSMYRVGAGVSGHGFPCEILALSPSHGDMLNFMSRLAADMPRSRQTKRAVPSPQPNHLSMATMISVGST